jgi:Tol biopolymer transport system component
VDSFAGTNSGLFAVSETGTLVYRGGSGGQTVITWFDMQGNRAGALGEPGEYSNPAISPDGGRVAVSVGPQGSKDIWILDVARGSNTRFTFDPAGDNNPVWSPDGKNVAFTSNRGGRPDLYIKPADGSGEERLLSKADMQKTAERFTKDGRFLLFDSVTPKTTTDMWALPLSGDATPVTLLQTQFQEGQHRVSPDGRWLAYTSTESGTPDIYVRPFTPEAPAGTGAKWLVSKGGGTRANWRPDGKELIYLNQGTLMAAPIDTSNGFQTGTPRRLFSVSVQAQTQGWDLAPDGQRVLYPASPDAGRVIPYTVVLNWAAGLKK